MGILSRISKVLESNLNALVEKAEDPSKVLEQAIDDMKRGRTEAKQALVDAMAEKRLIERRAEKSKGEANDYERKAMAALKQNNEDLARRCLELKIAADQRAEAELSAVAEQAAQIAQLQVAERELDRRLNEMPAKRAALLARQAAAQAKGARVEGAAKAQNRVSGAMEAFERMEEKVIRAEVEAEVVSGQDAGMMMLEASMTSSATEEALQALKQRMAKELPAGPAKATSEKKKGDPVEDSLADLKAKLTQD